MELWQVLISGLLGGGLVGFIEFLIRRSDEKKDRSNEIIKTLASIKQKIELIDERFNKENADDARRNILAFDDELRRKTEHSEESFNQVLDDINMYTRYCHNHPLYENNRAVAAIAHIKQKYDQVKESNGFI